MAGAKRPEYYSPELTEECKQVLALLWSGLVPLHRDYDSLVGVG